LLIYGHIYDYVILLQGKAATCFFVFSGEFLSEFLDRPGGILYYAGRFLGQFYHYKWLGALTVSGSIACFGALIYLVLAKLTRDLHIFGTFLLCILLSALHTSTRYVIHDTVGLITICGAFLGYLSIHRRASKHVYALLITPPLYFVVGGYVWFFAVWITVLEWLERPWTSNLVFKLLYPALAVCMPYAVWRFFPVGFSSAWTYPSMLTVAPFRIRLPPPAPVSVARYGYLVVGFSACLLLLPFWARISSGPRFKSYRRSKRGVVVWTALLIGLSASLLRMRYNSRLHEFVAYRQLYERGQWTAILDRAKTDRSGDTMVQFFTNYALCCRGELLEKMFSYSQARGTEGLVLDYSSERVSRMEWHTYNKGMYDSDLFFRMGNVNASFGEAYNHVIMQGRTYEGLKRMAECNMVNGNYRIAEKYLNILEKTLFHRTFAQRWKDAISDTVTADRSFAAIRKWLPTVDRRHVFPDSALLTAARSNPHNRMAVDYLFAWHLLNRSVGVIADNVGWFRQAGYTSMPTHCQEALLILQRQTGNRVDTGGFTYDAATVARVKAFLQSMRLHADSQNKQRELEHAFGDTYIYYSAFVGVPTAPNVPARPDTGGTP